LLERPPGDGHAGPVDEARVEQELQDRGDAPRPVEVFHHVATARLEIGETGRPVAHGLEVVDHERDAPAACATAMRWRTALVEPPSTVTNVMAFSKAARVMMSLGRRSRSRSPRSAAPAAVHSSSFAGSVAGMDALYGSVMPRASAALAIVLAVYMPPQAPAPGHACRTTCSNRGVSMVPARSAP